tara:strand:+ start:1285 stop:2031 length:747 start_codon:yes stop_codon:yes gene_type:complete
MLKKRIIITLSFFDGVLFRTKNFQPDYRYTKNFVDLWSIDELVLIDISKKKFSKTFCDTIKYFSSNCYVPITVGGGIKSVDDANIFFKHGADKVLLGSNSLSINGLIKKIATKFGNQSIIQSIDCKKIEGQNIEYTVMMNSGKLDTKINPLEYSKTALKLGAGEILVNSIDNDGSLLGYDMKLINLFSEKLNCPILALGGAGNWQHIFELLSDNNVSGACTQNIFHFTEESIVSAKKFLKNKKIRIRK